jgi:hypothetical protein
MPAAWRGAETTGHQQFEVSFNFSADAALYAL